MPLLLAGACLALCQCGGSKASNQRTDAGGDLRLDVGVPDLATADSRPMPDGQSDVPFEVQPDGQPDACRDCLDGGLPADGPSGLSREAGADAGTPPDLAIVDVAAGVDVWLARLDTALGGTVDAASEAASALEVARDSQPAGLDLAAVDATGLCNNLDDSVAPLHDEVYADGPVPTPVGGTIEDGLYYESAAEIYSTGNPAGPAGSKRRLVMRVAGASLEAAYLSTSDGEHRLESDTVGLASADAGTGNILLTQSCLSSKTASHLSLEMGYSAVGSGPGATLKFIYPTFTLAGLGSQTIVLSLIRQ